MSVAASLREGWSIAAAKPVGPGLRATLFEGSSDRIWATVSDKGDRGLLILVDPAESLSAAITLASRNAGALTAEIYSYVDGGKPVRGLLVCCISIELLDAFAGFCEPLIKRCSAGEPVAAAFAVCFDEFRRLVSVKDQEIPPSIVGLLGELIVLSDLVAMSAVATQCWSYPVLERHDFRNGAVAMEVKTTLRSHQGRAVVTINSVDQLEPPNGGQLFLHWLRLESDPGGVITLRRLLETIEAHVGRDVSRGMWGRLSRVTSIPDNQDKAFSIQERATYRVVDSFPRLSLSRLASGRLDPGLGKVTYELDLASAAAHRCSPVEANQALLDGAK